MSMYYRVFGANAVEPAPAALLEFLAGLGQSIEGRFQGDEQGWFRCHLVRGDTTMHLERYLTGEEGIRAELNTWAAWVEATGEGPERAALMQRLITTQQLMVLHDFPAELATKTCAYLASLTDGVYQGDSQGFFNAAEVLLLSEE